MTSDYLTLPTDAESTERLAASGLRMSTLDASDATALSPWLKADARGFHDPALTAEEAERLAGIVGYRRTTGIFDDMLADPDVPVGTVSSWPAPLTVSDGVVIDAWAISAVTVSPTHRRRGIARAMLEAELRTAAELGLSLAMLTVSEATIYGRYGFAPATFNASWTIDTARTRWAGPAASGRVQFITTDELKRIGPEVFTRTLPRTVGDIGRWDGLWSRFVADQDAKRAADLRCVRYDDADGVPQGFAIYRLREAGHHETELVVDELAAADDDAYAGLWRFLLEQDLVARVVADGRRVDEPVVWQLSNRRAAVKTREEDNLWLRILDPVAVLAARRYRSPGRFGFIIDDPLGYAEGAVVLEVADDGSATVSRVDELTATDAAVRLSVNELSAAYLGGVSLQSFAEAGRVEELADGSAARIDDAFRAPTVPWLSIIF